MGNWGSENWHYTCLGCGLDPEVVTYLRDTNTKVRRGYVCTCGAEVVDGIVRTFHGPESGKTVIGYKETKDETGANADGAKTL